MKLLLKKALENMPEEQGTVPVDEVAVADNEVALDIQQNTTDLDEGFDTVEELHQYTDIIQEANTEEGLTPREMQLVSVAIESVCNRLGIDVPQLNLSLEDFETDSKKSTAIALETVGEIAVQAGKKIVEYIKKFVQHVTDFLRSTLTFLPALRKTTDTLISELKQLNSVKLENNIECTDKGLVQRLSLFGANSVAAAYKQSMEAVITSTTNDYINTGISIYGQFITNLNNSDASKLKDNIESYNNYIVSYVGKIKTELYQGKNLSPEYVSKYELAGYSIYSTKAFLGGFGWYLRAPENNSSIAHSEQGTFKVTETVTDTLYLPLQNECAVILASAKAYFNIEKQIHDHVRQVQAFNRLSSALSAMAKQDSYHIQPQDVYAAHGVRDIVKAALKLSTGTVVGVQHYALSVTRDALKLVTMSVKEMKKRKVDSVDMQSPSLKLAAS